MMISLITAWIATVCVAFTTFKYFAKKNKKMNQIFHHIHIPLGILLIASGLVHGLFAGNPLGTTLGQASFGKMLFTWNMGTICFVLSVLLGITYLLRKILKNNWLKLHRALTVMLAVAIVIHICQMGIKLPHAISSMGNEADIAEENSPAESKDVTGETQTENTDSLVTFSGAVLKDGTYEGSADGYVDTITVSVVVQKGAVTDISIVEENDTPQFFEQAKEIIHSMINSQSLEVDGITGATYSSKGIQNAVYHALQNAVIRGELKITDIQITNSHGHGKKHR